MTEAVPEDEKVERSDIINALRHAHDEIITLRRHVEVIEPKAHAYDTIAQMTRLTIPEQIRGGKIDAAWRVKDIYERLLKEREVERPQP